MTLIAAVEAFRQCGYQSTVSGLSQLLREFHRLNQYIQYFFFSYVLIITIKNLLININLYYKLTTLTFTIKSN